MLTKSRYKCLWFDRYFQAVEGTFFDKRLIPCCPVHSEMIVRYMYLVELNKNQFNYKALEFSTAFDFVPIIDDTWANMTMFWTVAW